MAGHLCSLSTGGSCASHFVGNAEQPFSSEQAEPVRYEALACWSEIPMST